MFVPVRKLCLLGDYAVGKTRLAARLAGAGPDGARPGISVHRWSAGGAGCTVWDIDGRTMLDCLNQAFLAGADGFAVVADASRPDTWPPAVMLLQHARALTGDVPAVLLLNKTDLATVAALGADAPAGVPVFRTSATTGDGVDAAFLELAARASSR